MFLDQGDGKRWKKIPHIEFESGMYGYDGQSNYSDFSNLKKYVLHGIRSESTARVLRSSPISIEFDNEGLPS